MGNAAGGTSDNWWGLRQLSLIIQRSHSGELFETRNAVSRRNMIAEATSGYRSVVGDFNNPT